MMVTAMRMMLASAAVVLLFGCGSEVTYFDDGGAGGSGGTEPCPGADCLPPGCPATPPTVGTSCTLPDYTDCRYFDADLGDCHTTFSCQPVYPEAGAPSEWVFAGNDGICECVAVTCDPGDTQMDDCTPLPPCYSIDDPCSAGVIICSDVALPQHGCPQTEPLDGDSCTEEGQFCDYDLGNDCFTSKMCDGGQWVSIGGGCGGSG